MKRIRACFEVLLQNFTSYRTHNFDSPASRRVILVGYCNYFQNGSKSRETDSACSKTCEWAVFVLFHAKKCVAQNTMVWCSLYTGKLFSHGTARKQSIPIFSSMLNPFLAILIRSENN